MTPFINKNNKIEDDGSREQQSIELGDGIGAFSNHLRFRQ